MIPNMNPDIVAFVRCVLITEDGPQEGKWDHYTVAVLAFDDEGHALILGDGGRLQRTQDWIRGDNWYPEDQASIRVADRSRLS